MRYNLNLLETRIPISSNWKIMRASIVLNESKKYTSTFYEFILSLKNLVWLLDHALADKIS